MAFPPPRTMVDRFHSGCVAWGRQNHQFPYMERFHMGVAPKEISGPGQLDRSGATAGQLEIVLQAPQIMPQIAAQLPPAAWRCPKRRRIFAACRRLAERGAEPTVERLLLEIDDAQLKTLVIELDDLQKRRPRPDVELEATRLLAMIRNPSDVTPRVARPVPSDASMSEEELLRIIEKGRRRHGISSPTDG